MAFREAGHEVRILDALQLEVKIGKGVYLKGEKLSPSFIIPRFSGPILLAGLAAVREWEREGVRVLNSSRSLELAHDQLRTLQALSAASLPIAETSFCSQPQDEATLSSLTSHAPKVIKLLDSSQGRGVTLAPDAPTARSILSTLATLRSSGITQRFYPEAEATDYRLLVLNGAVIRAVKRTAKDGEFRANLHQGGKLSLYHPTSDERALALQACHTLGLNFAGIDLLPTNTENTGCVILEVNASPGLEGIEMGQEGFLARLLPACMENYRY